MPKPFGNAPRPGRDKKPGVLAAMFDPGRGAAKGFYKGRPELTGTTAYNHDWLNINRPAVPRNEGTGGKKKDKKNSGGGSKSSGGTPGTFNINMVTMNTDRSDRSVTNNNYMGGRGFVDDSEPDWGTPGTEFQDAEVFESMDHDLYNVRERGGGNWAAGGIGTGQAGIGPGGDQDALGI